MNVYLDVCVYVCIKLFSKVSVEGVKKKKAEKRQHSVSSTVRSQFVRRVSWKLTDQIWEHAADAAAKK